MNADKVTSIRMDFEDNDILALLSGEHNHYLAHIEKSLDVSLDSFGNSIKITGPAKSTKTARRVIEDLYKKLNDNVDIKNYYYYDMLIEYLEKIIH